MQASTWICTSPLQSIKVHELAPSTCVLLLFKNFDPSLFFNVASSLSMSNFHPSPMMHLHIFVPTSPPLSSISIKGVHLIDTKDCIGADGWYLNLAFLWTILNMLEWHQLIALEIPHVGSLTLIPTGRAPPLYHSMGHPLDKLELLYVRELSSFDDHLKLRSTCGTTIGCARCHL